MGLALAFAVCRGAAADEIPACRAIPPVVDVSVGRAPPALIEAMKRDIGAYALPGEDFDAIDVVRTRINRRLIWIRRREARWVVAYEQGGRIYNDPVLVYDLKGDGPATLVRRAFSVPQSVCQVTARELQP